MNDQSTVELLTDEFWKNGNDEPLAIDRTWTRVLIWDTHRTVDRYVRQEITAYSSAHSSSAGQLDWGQYQDYLSSETPEDWGEIVFEVHAVSDTDVYDNDFDEGSADCDYSYPFDVAYDDLRDSEKAAENYVRNLNPEYLKPII